LDIDLSKIKDWRVAASVELAQAEFKDHHLTSAYIKQDDSKQKTPTIPSITFNPLLAFPGRCQCEIHPR
jgi:hypothetical protein